MVLPSLPKNELVVAKKSVVSAPDDAELTPLIYTFVVALVLLIAMCVQAFNGTVPVV